MNYATVPLTISMYYTRICGGSIIKICQFAFVNMDPAANILLFPILNTETSPFYNHENETGIAAHRTWNCWGSIK